MKSILFAVFSLAFAYAAAVSDSEATVINSRSQQTPEGDFQFGFETDNGISVNADGKIKTLSKDEVALEVVGSSGYVAPDGEKIQLTYIANEFGYQPQGEHLPTPPAPIPLPEYVVRALRYIEEHPYKEVV